MIRRSRAAAVVAGLTALSLAACSDDDDAPDAGVSTTTTEAEPATSTTADRTSTTIGEVLPDGEHVGYISSYQEMDDSSYGMSFDLAYLLTGQEAIDAADAAGVELDTDYYIQNDNDRTRIVDLAPDIVITVLGEGDDCCEPVEMSVHEMNMWINPTRDFETGELTSPLMRLTIEQGLVTRIDEVYLS